MNYFVIKVLLTLSTGLIACAVVLYDWHNERRKLPFSHRKSRMPNRYLLALAGVIVTTIISVFTDTHEREERRIQDVAQSRRDSLVKAGIDSSLFALSVVSTGLVEARGQIEKQGNQLMSGIVKTTDELYGMSNSIDSGFENNFTRLIKQQNIIENVYSSMMLSQKISMSENYPISYWILNFIIAYPIPESTKSVLASCVQECTEQASHSIGLENPQCIDVSCFDEMRGDVQMPNNPPLRLNVTDVKNGYMRIVELFVMPMNNRNSISMMYLQSDTLYVSYNLKVKNSSTLYAKTHPKLNLWDLDDCNLELDIYPYEMNWNGFRGKITSDILINFDRSEISLRIQPWDLCATDYGTYSLSLANLESHVDHTSMLWGHDRFGPFVFGSSMWHISKCR